MGVLIIIEGSDGSGKQTQTELLFNSLKNKYENILKIQCPNYDNPGSALVKMYLNGNFGKDPSKINPYATSIFYAADRFSTYIKDGFKEVYENDGIVIADRYTTSNMIHQATKLESKELQDTFITWIKDLEYSKIGLPKPDIVFFLNMPYEFSQTLIKNRDNKIDGSKVKDIHESSRKYLENTYIRSLDIAKREKWAIINCIDSNKNIKSIEEIHKEILGVLERELNV